MQWWAWIVLGFLLLVGELLTPGGFYILFFGIGAIAVGLLTRADLAGPGWTQWLLFTGLSVGLLSMLRRRLVQMMPPPKGRGDADSLVGETALVLEDMAAGAIGKAEMRGTAWSARNIGSNALARGQRCKVAQVEGLTLCLRSE